MATETRTSLEAFAEKAKILLFPALLGVVLWFATQMLSDLKKIQENQVDQMKEMIHQGESIKTLQWRIERLEHSQN